MVLIMSVKTGAGGQKFNKIALEHIDYVRKLNPVIDIEVDGGIGFRGARGQMLFYWNNTAYNVAKAGANILVAGNAIYKESDQGLAISNTKLSAEVGHAHRMY